MSNDQNIVNRHFRSLKTTLLVNILIVSSVITTILTVFSFYSDYQSEMSELDSELRQVQSVTVPALTKDLWALDTSAIQSQIASLQKLQPIVSVEVQDEDKNTVSNASDDVPSEYLFTRSYTLRSSSEVIGYLNIQITRKYIYQRLSKRAAIFFLSQGVKTLLVSLIILYIFRYYVTNHLIKISNFFRDNSFKSESLILSNRPKEKYNEIDVMVKAINEMTTTVNRSELDLKKNLEIQRASAINSARLASLGEMAGGIAHEINNPLSIITGNLRIIQKLLTEQPDQIDKVNTLLDKLTKTCDRISKIIRSLRTYARNAEGDPKEPVSVLSIIEETLPFCRERFRNHEIDLRISEFDPSYQVECRFTEISQVLVSLLNNSSDAIESLEDRWISIDVKLTADDFIQVVVTDSGSGIPQDVLDKIFDPFFTTKEVGRGTGLGLSIAKKIVENHNGRFEVDVSNPHTSFLVSLPRYLG